MSAACGVELAPGFGCLLDEGHDGAHQTSVHAAEIPAVVDQMLWRFKAATDALERARRRSMAWTWILVGCTAVQLAIAMFNLGTLAG